MSREFSVGITKEYGDKRFFNRSDKTLNENQIKTMGNNPVLVLIKIVKDDPDARHFTSKYVKLYRGLSNYY